MSSRMKILFCAVILGMSLNAFSETEPTKPVVAAPAKPQEHANVGHENKATDSKDAWAAIKELQAGNKRFIEGQPNNANQDKITRERLAAGQQPPVIVLSCSDSRVPPEKVLDQGLGQIFTVRLAGHIITADSIASIEYAIEHLGSKVLVVMGHESCGAVKAALTVPPGKSAGSPSLDSLIAKIRPGIAAFKISPNDKTLEGPVKANVTAAVKELVKKSKIVREALEANHLLLAQAIYHLASGEVEFWSLGQPIVILEASKPASSSKKGTNAFSSHDH